jgi:hypothetical protein
VCKCVSEPGVQECTYTWSKKGVHAIGDQVYRCLEAVDIKGTPADNTLAGFKLHHDSSANLVIGPRLLDCVWFLQK